MSSPRADDELRQGDWLVGLASVTIDDADGESHTVETPLGVAVVTQCCDLAHDPVGQVQVAPIVTLEGSEYADARSGRTPRYAPLDDEHFADFSVVATVTRNAVSQPVQIRNRMTTPERQSFANCYTRRFGRFAFPDEVVEVLRPLATKIRKSALKSGAIGQVLERVVTMRMECEPAWDADSGLTLTLLVVVAPEFLPSTDDLSDEPLGKLPMRPQQLDGAAQAIVKCTSRGAELSHWWDEFGDELLKLFQSGAAEQEASGYIAGVYVEVLRTDDLTFERYRNTVDLDFDYLSEIRDQASQ